MADAPIHAHNSHMYAPSHHTHRLAHAFNLTRAHLHTHAFVTHTFAHRSHAHALPHPKPHIVIPHTWWNILPCTHAFAHRHIQIDTATHANADTKRAIHQHAQICLPLHFWIMLLIFFFSMSPTSCNGAWTNSHPPISLHGPCLIQYNP